jgi:hypothetical protein
MKPPKQPVKRGPGRQPLTPEQKAQLKAEREADDTFGHHLGFDTGDEETNELTYNWLKHKR